MAKEMIAMLLAGGQGSCVNYAEMEITLRNSERLPLSRTCKNALKERLAKGGRNDGP